MGYIYSVSGTKCMGYIYIVYLELSVWAIYIYSAAFIKAQSLNLQKKFGNKRSKRKCRVREKLVRDWRKMELTLLCTNISQITSS